MRAILLVALLAAAGSLAADAAGLQVALSTREQNRQAILAVEGPAYSPAAPVRVLTTDPAGAVTVRTMSAAQALDLQLDRLDANGISLAQAGAASSDPPQWPLAGVMELHDRGWYQSGARCPVPQPGWPPQLAALFDGSLPGEGDQVGSFTSDLSESYLSPSGSEVTSTLKFWAAGQDSATAEPSTWRFGGLIDEGWTLLAGLHFTEAAGLDYFCKEPAPPATTGVVLLDAIVEPVMDRTDD